MTIVVTGGGSGGHITPLLAVAHELKTLRNDVTVVYIGQKGDGLSDVPAQDSNIDSVYLIRAGKFRRYHGEGLKQLLDLPTVYKNLRDAIWVIIGLWQSYRLLRRLKPEAVFVKGGFVGVPVGLSAALLRIPYVTHDSDALPGLANRIIAKWAAKHTVGLPKEVYAYPPDKTMTVGVPLLRQYQPFNAQQVRAAREQIDVPPQGKLLLVTGGGLGAQRLNQAVAACLPDLLERYKDLTVIQIAGRANETELRQLYQRELPPSLQARVAVKGFITNLYLYSGAADLVVSRAGATSMAEFAVQQKACIVVPNPLLTGGHQLKNAKVLADRRAVRLVSEDKLSKDDKALLPAIVDLLDHPDKAASLGRALGKIAQPDSAKKVAMVLLEVAASHQ